MKAVRAIARVALVSALAAGCQTHAASCPDDPTVSSARASWTARHIADYRFVWQQSCFCAPDATQPVTVTVRHGEIVSATDRSGAAVSDEIRKNVMTIDALYQHADAARCTAAEVRVVARDGVPTSVFIDPNRRAADEEFRVTISDFSTNP
jgi:hypothetical protein